MWAARRLASTAALLGSGATALALGGDRVPLASSVNAKFAPTTVLVHGLDSSKETWKGVLAALAKEGKPALALDQRGHGESPLGDPASFSAEALARDVIEAVEGAHGVQRPWILVGHSMGGRVAMEVAAISAKEAPDRLAAVVVEDMDAVPRASWAPTGDAPTGFERRLPSLDAVREALGMYPADRIEGWLGARVRELGSDGEYWSDINPEAQALARRHVLHSDAATKAWTALAASRPAFPVHLWVAGPQVDGWGTVATWDGPDGIHDLVKRLPGTTAVEFPKAGHSIHNSDADAFVARLLKIIYEVEDGIVRSKK